MNSRNNSDKFLLESMTIVNYRCFDRLDLNFSPGFNVIVGDNGSGKSSILNGLATSLGTWFLGLPEVKSKDIHEEEVREVRRREGDIVNFYKKGECVLSSTGSIFGDTLSWSRTKFGGGTTYKKSESLIEKSKAYDERLTSGKHITLPIISYYGTGRLWGHRNLGVVKKTKVPEEPMKSNRYTGYLNALDPASNEMVLKRWVSELAKASFHEGRMFESLNVVYEAISNNIEGASRVFWGAQDDDLLIEFEAGDIVPMYLLSDGQRNVCATIGDIAMRCVQLNPHLEHDAVFKTPGVVLIDEIDLHLHPKWQRKIVNSLKNTFKNIQFIVSTHSPFIIQSLKKSELIMLTPEKAVNASMNEELGIEDTIERFMGLENVIRSELFNQTVKLGKEVFELEDRLRNARPESEEYNELQGLIDMLRKKLTKDSAFISDNPLITAFLKAKL